MRAATILAVACALATPAELAAHVPHDIVNDLTVSPSFAQDATVFAVVRRRLYKSTDGGYHWQRLSRGLGTCSHWLTALALSPRYDTDQTLFVSCRKKGVYRSTDGGRSWYGKLLPTQDIIAMAASPHFDRDGTVLAISEGGSLFRSANAGDSWYRVLKEPEITAFDREGSVVVAGTSAGALYMSADGGGRWREYARLSERRRITAVELPVGFGLGDPLFVGTERGGVHQVSGDRTVEPGGRLLADRTITALATIRAGGRQTVLATTWKDAVYRSTDAATTWTKHDAGLKTDIQADHYGMPHFTQLAVTDDGVAFVGAYSGLFRSDDEGRSWDWLLPTTHHIVSLDVSPQTDRGHVVGITTYGSGAYTTVDDGASWRVHNAGLPNTRLGPIMFSPDFAADRTLFTATFDVGLRSDDGGKVWRQTRLTPSSPGGWRQRLARWFSLGPTPPSYVEGVEIDVIPLVFAASPDFAADQTLFAGMYPNGVLRTQDGGRSFALIWSSLDLPVSAVVVSPDYAADRTLFAAPWGSLHRTRDGGESWHRIGGSIDLASVDPGKAALAISPGFARDGIVYLGGPGLFVSRDRGDTWRELELPGDDGRMPVAAIAVAPVPGPDRVLLVQTEGGNLFVCRHTSDGRFEATASAAADSGLEFSQLFKRESAPLIGFSPSFATDATAYASSFQQLFKSTDGGQTWHALPRQPQRHDVDVEYGRIEMILPTHLTGTWQVQTGAKYSNGEIVYSDERGASASLRFVGTGIDWLGTRGPDGGRATVHIDGTLRAKVDQHSRESTNPVTVFSATDLTDGPHTITITVAGASEPSSSGARVDIDALDVTAGGAR